MQFGSHSFYETSFQHAYESVGSLSMVSIEQIKQDNNIDYLQNVCTFIQQMNINPLWFESQNDRDKLKLLQLYQLAITYSKNLSQNYNIQIQRLQAINKKQKDENEDKVQQIKLQKEMFRKKKEQYKICKHKRYKKIFHKLKDQLQEAEEESRVEEHPHYYPYPPYYGYPGPHHPVPPHYPPYNYSPQPTPFVQSSNQSPGQSIPMFNPQNIYPNSQQQSPMSMQQQIASNLMGRFGGLNNQRVKNQNSNIIRLKPQVPVYPANNNVINSRKIDRSFLRDEQSQEEHKEPMENSQILNTYEINKMMDSNKPPSLNKKPLQIDKSKRKADLNQNIVDDDFEDFGNLTAQSKKSISKKQDPNQNSHKIAKQQILSPPSIKIKKQQPPQQSLNRFKKQEAKTPSIRIKKQQEMEQASKNSNDSYELAQYDSIADMRLGNNQSKLQKGEKILPFQSKVIANGGIQNKKQKLSIPNYTSSVNQTNISQDLELAADSKFTKRTTSQNSRFLNQKPQRFSKTFAKDKQQNQDNAQSFGMESDSFNINLNLNSRMNVKKKEKRESSGEQYGQINNSNINRKGKNHNQKKEPLQMMHDRPPQRRGNMKKIEQQNPYELRVSSANSAGLNESKNKMIQSQTFKVETHLNPLQQTNEDYNIKLSRMGINKSGNYAGSSAQPVFSGRTHLKRASSDTNNQVQLQIKQQRKQVEQEQQNYQQKFQQYDDILNFNEEALEKTHVPKLSKEIKIEQDDYMLDFDQQKLQQSHRPNSKKQLKVQETKQLQKSQVDIKVPSFNSIQQISKYHKLTNQQFKLIQKKNTLNVQSSNIKIEDSLQSFDDFIAFIPPNSIIAKPSARFLPSTLIRQPKTKANNPASLQDLPIYQISEGSTSKQISINLISPANQKEKLLTKKQQNGYKKQQQIKSVVNDNIRSSNLLVIDNSNLQSIIMPNNSKNKMLYIEKDQEKANYYKPQVAAQKNIEMEEVQQEEIIDSSFEDMSKSSKNEVQNDFRHQIIRMIKESENVNSLPIPAERFNDKLFQDLIKDICKVDLKNLQRAKLANVQKELQKQLQKVIKQKELKSKKFTDIIKQENIQIKQVLPRRESEKQKPKPNKSAVNNDSLNYSRSFVNQKLESTNKNAKVEMKIDSNITDSTVFDNPYTPQPNQSKLQEPPKQTYDKKQPLSANPFLLENNKSLGTKQQNNLFKNVGQGISKYDKDDPLQRQITYMMNQKAKIQEEEEFDQW